MGYVKRSVVLYNSIFSWKAADSFHLYYESSWGLMWDACWLSSVDFGFFQGHSNIN